MSIVRQQTEELAPAVEAIQLSDTPVVELDEQEVNDSVASTGIINVTLHGVFDTDDLMQGAVFKLSDYAIGNLPSNKVIVSEVASTALGSHVGCDLMVSANLFNSNGNAAHYLESGVQNSEGWVTVNDQDSVVPLGFAPLLNIMPNEMGRGRHVHYIPGKGVDDQLVQRYGHLTSGDSLRNGVVAFPKENYYYVAKDHVVLDIIEKNWEVLGQSVPHERVREGNWVKVATGVVDKVLSELDSNVLKHMPVTDLNNLKFSVKAGQELASNLDAADQYPVSVSLAIKYRSVAPETES